MRNIPLWFRIITISLMVALGYLAPLPFFVVGALVYAFLFTGYELLVIGVLIDAQFGSVTGTIPYLYTLVIGGLLLVASLTKPFLKFYE